ncbi:hypothetical protein EB796_006966 [Bugula neritina]|uniref:Uncharacterized protein n=1 Tax=Bugula neritina TaxID=10212 RepID=A0A7J7K942_BUGNE|nr:hypothetical protein EB796_006966 [Bugula neritina]
MFVLFSKGAWSHGPTYSGLIEDIEGLLNDRNYKVSLVLVSEQNGEVKESDPVSTFFKTPPNKPTELSGVRLINNRVKLFWNDQQSSLLEEYRVHICQKKYIQLCFFFPITKFNTLSENELTAKVANLPVGDFIVTVTSIRNNLTSLKSESVLVQIDPRDLAPGAQYKMQCRALLQPKDKLLMHQTAYINIAPMVAKEFLVTIGGNDDFIVKIDPPPNETLSGQPSFYNGLILNYSVVGSDQQQQVIGV